jgi:hypothetical protein
VDARLCGSYHVRAAARSNESCRRKQFTPPALVPRKLRKGELMIENTGIRVMDAEQQLKSFVAKFGPKDQKLIRAIRSALRKRFPTANELVWDNYNFFVIGYSPTERPTDSIVSMAARANGVGLCFIHGAALPDPHRLLLGSGKQTRFVRLKSAARLAEPEVEELISAAVSQAEISLPRTGRGRLIIRSISAKKRPRQRPK